MVVSAVKPLEHFEDQVQVARVDANAIAIKYGLGSRATPIVNTAIIGAFAGATGLVSLEAVVKAVEEFVPMKKKDNMKATEEAFKNVETIEKK